jgi:hypothetical protein
MRAYFGAALIIGGLCVIVGGLLPFIFVGIPLIVCGCEHIDAADRARQLKSNREIA